MSTWIVGDVHGHFEALQRLLLAIDYTAGDRLIFVGDLVSGGGRSLEVLRWCADQDVSVTLGNHDLHMLAVWSGAREHRRKDDFDDVLDAPDAPELVQWLTTRSLTCWVEEFETLVVHAGLVPQWTATKARSVGAEVEQMLRGSDSAKFFAKMYGNTPRRWKNKLRGARRLRCAVNALTRIRIVNPEGKMEFEFSGTYKNIPRGWTAWFEHRGRKSRGTSIVAGHWSALGIGTWGNFTSLDAGVRWGRSLAAMRLEDRKIVQVDAR